MKFCKNITLNVKLLTNVGVFSYSFPDVICKDILTVSSFYNDPSEQVLSYSFNGETGLNKFEGVKKGSNEIKKVLSSTGKTRPSSMDTEASTSA